MNTWKHENLTIYNEDFLKAPIDENSVDLLVTSPPYNVDIQYGDYKDGIPYDEYLKFSKEWGSLKL